MRTLIIKASELKARLSIPEQFPTEDILLKIDVDSPIAFTFRSE